MSSTQSNDTTKHVKLRSLIEQLSKFAEDCFKEAGRLMPTYVLVKPDENAMMFPAPHPDKDVSKKIVQVMMKKFDIVRYVFFDESWALNMSIAEMTEEEVKETVHLAKTVGIANHPKRIEVVFFTGEDAEGQVIAKRNIIRPTDRTIKPYLGPLEFDDPQPDHSEGRLVGVMTHGAKR